MVLCIFSWLLYVCMSVHVTCVYRHTYICMYICHPVGIYVRMFLCHVCVFDFQLSKVSSMTLDPLPPRAVGRDRFQNRVFLCVHVFVNTPVIIVNYYYCVRDYVYIRMNVRTCVRVYVRVYICIYVHVYVCMCVHVCICMYIRMYVCMYIRMYVCMYVCTYVCVVQFMKVNTLRPYPRLYYVCI